MDIQKRIEIIVRKIKGPIEFSEENCNLPLTGSLMKFTPVELAYLVLELSEEFHIRFEKEDFEDYRFNTLSAIINIVTTKVGTKHGE